MRPSIMLTFFLTLIVASTSSCGSSRPGAPKPKSNAPQPEAGQPSAEQDLPAQASGPGGTSSPSTRTYPAADPLTPEALNAILAGQVAPSEDLTNGFVDVAQREYGAGLAAFALQDEDTLPELRRAVVVVNDSTTGSSDPSLFTKIDWGMKFLFDRGIAGSYTKQIYFGAGDATWPNFQRAVAELAQDASVDVVDVIINLHGGPDTDGRGGVLVFNDGAVSASKIATDLTAAVPQAARYKLRAVYNQACFGATQIPGFIEAGFISAAGTRGIHTTGFVDFPAFTRNWAGGNALEYSVGPQALLFKAIRFIADWRARMGDSQVDNTWELRGQERIGIDTRLLEE